MRKKQETYIPQFKYDDLPSEENTENELLKCEKCGKYSVSLHSGVCFECRQKEPSDSLKIIVAEKQKKKNKIRLIFEIILYSFFGLLSLLVIIDVIPLESYIGNTFSKSLATAIAYLMIFVFGDIIFNLIKLLIFLFKKLINKIKK